MYFINFGPNSGSLLIHRNWGKLLDNSVYSWSLNPYYAPKSKLPNFWAERYKYLGESILTPNGKYL